MHVPDGPENQPASAVADISQVSERGEAHVENDIGRFTGAAGDSLTTERRVSVLCNVWTPGGRFSKIPKSNLGKT